MPSLRQLCFTALTMAAFTASVSAQAKIATGSPVGDVVVTDSNGKQHNLSDYQGKTVILEWTNDGCPYVQKHYDSSHSNMQNLQKDAHADGIIWISVISSAPGKQGYVSGEQANTLTTTRDAAPLAVALDPTGEIGKKFSAKTTPHMFIIDAEQTLVYQGAIDDERSARASAIPGAKNYVRAALNDLKAGQTVKISDTSPYGCSVKYAS